MSDTTYQDLVKACRDFYDLDRPPFPWSLPPKLEDTLTLRVQEKVVDVMPVDQLLAITFRTLEADKKHSRLPAKSVAADANPARSKRPRMQEPPKIVNASSVILIPDSRSSTPDRDESGDDGDYDEFDSDDGDDSSASGVDV